MQPPSLNYADSSRQRKPQSASDDHLPPIVCYSEPPCNSLMILACIFLNETLHHLPAWSKRSVIAVKRAPYGSEGNARPMLVAMFKTAAANTLCKCMNLFQRSHGGTGGERAKRAARTQSLDWFEQPPVNR